LSVVCAFTGNMVVEIETGRKSLGEVYTEIDTALGSGFIFRLVDGTQDVAAMATADTRGPLKVVKLRQKGLYTYGLHGVLKQIQAMEGSRNVCSQGRQ
jgi:hypothetical protein